MRVLLVFLLVFAPPAILALSFAGDGPGPARSGDRAPWGSSRAEQPFAIELRGDDDDDDDDDFTGVAEFFVEDPLVDPDFIVDGAALDRVRNRVNHDDRRAAARLLCFPLTAELQRALPALIRGR